MGRYRIDFKLIPFLIQLHITFSPQDDFCGGPALALFLGEIRVLHGGADGLELSFAALALFQDAHTPRPGDRLGIPAKAGCRLKVEG